MFVNGFDKKNKLSSKKPGNLGFPLFSLILYFLYYVFTIIMYCRYLCIYRGTLHNDNIQVNNPGNHGSQGGSSFSWTETVFSWMEGKQQQNTEFFEK